MPGVWHNRIQNLFSADQKEVAFALDACNGSCKRRRIADVCVNDVVIEIQHSPIARDDICERNRDYEQLGKTVVWVIDCTENKSQVRRISSDEDKTDVWMLEFDHGWQVEPFQDCKVVFAVFVDAT